MADSGLPGEMSIPVRGPSSFLGYLCVYVVAFFSLAARTPSLGMSGNPAWVENLVAQQSRVIRCPGWNESVCGNRGAGTGWKRPQRDEVT